MGKNSNWRWVFSASAETVERVRQLANQEPAIVIARLIRAPNVDCVYWLAKHNRIVLTAGQRGGPTLAHQFTHESFKNLHLAAARRGLDRYEFFQKFLDVIFTDADAQHLITTIMDDAEKVTA